MTGVTYSLCAQMYITIRWQHYLSSLAAHHVISRSGGDGIECRLREPGEIEEERTDRMIPGLPCK